jgi:hypothetical protein
MKILRVLALVAGATILAVSMVPTAKAFDEKTVVTFSEAVELPGGVVLQPGKYTLSVLPNNKKVVRIMNSEQTRLYAMVFADPVQRARAPERAEVTLHGTSVGKPRPLCVWFYPGERTGWVFHHMPGV